MQKFAGITPSSSEAPTNGTCHSNVMDSPSGMELAARLIRGKLVELSHRAKTPHLASALSCVDILVAAYWGVLDIRADNLKSPQRDRFIISKGHAAPALYATLAFRGLLPFEVLDTFARPGSPLAEQPSPGCVPGVEWATGSLGHGLGAGIGMALAARIKKLSYRVMVLLGDGECNEGSVWEAAMFAPKMGLKGLTVIIDFNKWQATGRSRDIMALDSLRDKWEAFGWAAFEVDGHDTRALQELMKLPERGERRPVAIIAHTVKGRGVDFMEDDNNWHYLVPNEEQVASAHRQLGLS